MTDTYIMVGFEIPEIKKKRNVFVNWFIRIFGTLFVFALVLLVVIIGWSSYDKAKENEFANLDPIAQRVEVYEAFWKIIDEKFYDENFNGLNWQAQRKIGLERAKAAKDAIELWQVLNEESNLLLASHMSVDFPHEKKLKALQTIGNLMQISKKHDEFLELTKGNFEYDPIDMGWQMTEIRRGQGVLSIVGEVRPNSVAAKVGIKPGWIVESSNTILVSDRKFRFKGNFWQLSGDNIELKTQESRTDFEVKLSDQKQIPTMTKVIYDFQLGSPDSSFSGSVSKFVAKPIPKNIIYLRFDSFLELKTINSAIKFIEKNQTRQLILDLRFNEGGTYHNLNWFLASIIGPTQKIGTLINRGKSSEIYSLPLGKKRINPIVVLIGPGTKSAAEICAKELQLKRNALLIGRRTAGEVLFSRSLKLPDGTSMKVPFSKFIATDGSPIEGVGVKPDIEIFPTSAELNAGRDVVLERAIFEFEKQKPKPN